MARRRRGTNRPPPGFYDPGLDVQLRASRRGLRNTRWDVERTGSRNLSDLILGGGDIQRQRTELGEDVTRQRTGLETDYGRSLTDLLTQRTQAGEDYTRNLAQLQRNYDRLGSAQAQQQRAAGVAAGGAAAQAARKRTANQAWERAPIDLGQKRFMEGSQLAQARLGQDRQTGLSDLLRSQRRGGEALDRAGGQLGLTYKRGAEDLSTTLTRAQREQGAFERDVEGTKFEQATQMGWKPPPPPKTAAQRNAAQMRRQRQAERRARARARRR